MINKNRIKSKRKKNITNQSEKFRSLAPVTSEIKFNRYWNMFKTAFSKRYITNIAVTGPYASGKSSIMQACKKKYGEDKFITLSLTNFTQENNSDKKEIEENLEAQLVNQLIHKIDNKKIKDSRFIANKKIDTKKWLYKLSTIFNTVMFTLYIICGILLSINNNILETFFLNNLIDLKQLSFNTIFFISFIYIPYISYKLISLFKQKKILKKINIYGNDLELFPNEEESIFDKHTDEILYLFENARVNYFIFEDIDRYEDVTVFKKLREINILLNDKREKKPLIKFIYLICDNMFTAEERTKFFDFIIPVVPYIHKGNAYDYMAELFADEIKDERNKKFLIKVSLFIDNSRLIKNIANEYYIYSKFIKLQNRKPHTKFIKLLSLIIYKNLFPKDFNLLYFNKGYLAELFNKEVFAKRQEKSVEEYKNKTIKECIDVNNKDNFFKALDGYDYIYDSGYMNLIKFLITDGYIDETYKDYISEITENSLTYEERAFLQNIVSHNGEQFLTYLNRINEKKYLDNFLNFIDIEDTKRFEILNIYLLENIAYQYFNNGEVKFKIIHETILQNLIYKNTEYLFINYYYQYLISLYNITENMNIELQTNTAYDSFIYLIINNYKILRRNILNKDNPFSFVSVILNILMVYKNNFIDPNDEIKKEIEEIKLDISTNEIYISALENNLTDNILFHYKHEHYNQNNIFNNFNTQQNNSFQLSIEDMDKEKWLTQDILNLLKETGIYFNNINNISSIDFFNLLLNTQSFDVNYKNILYIAEIYNPDVNMQYIENVFDTLFIIQDKSLQKYIFSRFDNLIKTYSIIPKYNENIEKETYNKILESDFISIEHKEIFKNYFNSQE